MKELIDTAPLGLDFERPEEVWVLRRAKNSEVLGTLERGTIRGWVDEASASRFRDTRLKKKTGTGHYIGEFDPFLISIRALRSDPIRVATILSIQTSHGVELWSVLL